MTVVPERYIVFDTESHAERADGDVPTQRLSLRLGSLLYVERGEHGPPREEWHDFRTDDEFHDFLSALPFTTAPVVVLAHNIGFDVRQVNWWWWMGQGRYTLTHPGKGQGGTPSSKVTYVTDSPPFIVRLYAAMGQAYLLLDTYQWLGAPLHRVGEWIGEPKGEMPAPDAPDAAWWDYCRRDVNVLHEALKRLWGWLDRYRMPRWAYTPAMQSMQLYMMRYAKGRIVKSEDPEPLALDRHAYYAGLAEAFRVGEIEGPLYQLDVSSLYPSVMRENPFPCEVLNSGDASMYPDAPAELEPWDTTAEVWLETPAHPFPVRASNGTHWVTGRVRTALCGPELARAHSLGVIRRVGHWVRYRMDAPFGEFVDFWWLQRMLARREGRPLDEAMCKRILNSLHGKFGQRSHQWADTGIRWDRGKYGAGIAVTMDKDVHTYWRIVAGVEFSSPYEGEDPRGFVPIAAWTASYGRCAMWDAIYTAGLDHVFHCATDSLIVDGVGLGQLQLAGLVDAETLGLFRHVATEDRCTIHGVHSIDWGAKRTRPGVKNGAIEVAPDVWHVEKWIGFEEDLSRGNLNSVSIETWFLSTSRKSLRRAVSDDGSTSPRSIDNWGLTLKEQSRMPIRG